MPLATPKAGRSTPRRAAGSDRRTANHPIRKRVCRAGQTARPRRRARRDLRRVFPDRRCASPRARARSRCLTSAASPSARRRRCSPASGWRCAIEPPRRADPKVAGRPRALAGPGGRHRSLRRQRAVRVASATASARPCCRASSASRSGPPSSRFDAGRHPDRATRRDSIGRLSGRHRRRAGSAGEAAASATVTLLVNRGESGASYVMPDLIGTPGLLVRGRAAQARASACADDRRVPYPGLPPGIVVRQTPQAGFQIGDRRADLARGQPMSVRIAPSILSADFARLADAVAHDRSRRRRPHPRGRDGRPLRAEHHDRPAGRGRAQARDDAAARRAPDDQRARPVPRSVRRGGRGDDHRARGGRCRTCIAR